MSENKLTDGQQKQMALQMILEAWENARRAGVGSEMLSSAAVFAALTEMVELYGEDPVADLVEGWPARIRAGEFSPPERDPQAG